MHIPFLHLQDKFSIKTSCHGRRPTSASHLFGGYSQHHTKKANSIAHYCFWTQGVLRRGSQTRSVRSFSIVVSAACPNPLPLPARSQNRVDPSTALSVPSPWGLPRVKGSLFLLLYRPTCQTTCYFGFEPFTVWDVSELKAFVNSVCRVRNHHVRFHLVQKDSDLNPGYDCILFVECFDVCFNSLDCSSDPISCWTLEH